MGKFKLARKKEKGGPPKPGAVPCAIVIVGVIVLMSLLFYSALSSSVK
ncbi:MAG TPA: hypothetical protein VM120_07380 [Bryobacteraceae bacterium]|nr:hypothetical protein [Bryobacteraceae bacterium]